MVELYRRSGVSLLGTALRILETLPPQRSEPGRVDCLPPKYVFSNFLRSPDEVICRVSIVLVKLYRRSGVSLLDTATRFPETSPPQRSEPGRGGCLPPKYVFSNFLQSPNEVICRVSIVLVKLYRRSGVSLLDTATRFPETSPPQRSGADESVVCHQICFFEFLANSQRGHLSSLPSFGVTSPPQRSEPARHGDPPS